MRHAFDLLSDPPATVPDVVGLFGGDATLRSWCVQTLTQADGESDRQTVEGETADWPDVHDDLCTASLFDFGGGKSTVVIRDADAFVSKFRDEVGRYIDRPAGASRLILAFDSLASNTKIYKSLDKSHLLVACGSATDSKKGVTAATRRKFLTRYVAPRHQCKIDNAAADRLVDAIGEDIGMLDTEIAKLALFIKPGETISTDLIDQHVHGWQAQTVWQITDAIAGGRADEALRQLDRLISGGQKPIALLPQIAWSLRRLGLATAMVMHYERAGKSRRLEDCIEASGARPYEVTNISKTMRTMGRERAAKLLPWLLDADLRLKGTHSAEPRDRFLLENFVMRLANQ